MSRPRGAARLRRRTGDPDSPEGSAASSRFFALWYRIRSPREFGNKSAEHVLRGGVVGKVEVSSGEGGRGASWTRLRVRSLSGGTSPRGFFVYPTARFSCWNRARQRPGPGPNTHSPRSQMRGFDSYSYFDARVSKNCSAFAVVRSRSWCARWPVWERSGPAEGVAVGRLSLSFCLCSLHLSSVGGTEVAPRPRTAYLSLGCCFGPEQPGLFDLGSGRAGVTARAARFCAAGASGEKFFLCVCVVARPVSGVGAPRGWILICVRSVDAAPAAR